MNQLKITKRLPLPVHLISETGIVEYFAAYHDQAFSIIGTDKIIFFDHYGNVLKQIDIKDKTDFFGDRNIAFAYEYHEIKEQDILHLHFYKLNQNNQLITDTFRHKDEDGVDYFWDGTINMVHFLLENKGYTFMSYEDDCWKEKLCLPTHLYEYYASEGAESIDLNVKDEYVAFVSETNGQLFLYDYNQHSELNEIDLGLKGEIAASYFIDDYYVVHENTNDQINFHIYSTQTWERLFFKPNIVGEEMDDKNEKIAFVLPDNKIQVCTFPRLNIIAKSNTLPSQLFDNTQLVFSNCGNILMVSNNDEAFFIEWSENARENMQFYWNELTPKLEHFYAQIETWKEHDIKKVMIEVEKEHERTQFIIKREFSKRYIKLLGEKHLFWK